MRRRTCQLSEKFKPNRMEPGMVPREKGVVAIIVALSMVVLIGFVGLALDLGKLFVAKTELQNAADSCALAAARELTGANTNQLTLAEAAGIAAGMENSVLFQDETVNFNADDSVTFSEQLSGSYVTKGAAANPLNMRFVRCTVERTGIVNWFMQVLGIGDQDVAATAVASLVPGQTTCAIPAGMCLSDFLTANPGDWIEGALGPQGDMTGGFKWIDFTPPGGGASELNAALTGPGDCSLPAIGSTVGQGGVVSSLSKGWNSRFGIYTNNVESDPGQPDFAVPDWSGYAYTEVNYPAQFDAFSDFVSRRANYAAYQGDALTGLRAERGNSNAKPTAFLQQHGADRRLATVAVVDCPTLDAGAPTAPVQAWACVFMLHPINTSQGGSGTGASRMFLEYQGRADDAASPCASSGMVGGPGSIGPLVPALVQ